MCKVSQFFGSFFRNIAADPVSSLKGVISLGACAGVCFGMATGALPVTVGIPLAASFATSGIHALGTDNNTKVESPTAVAVEKVVTQVAGVTPPALSVIEQLAKLKDDATTGQAKITQYEQAAKAVAAILQPQIIDPAVTTTKTNV